MKVAYYLPQLAKLRYHYGGPLCFSRLNVNLYLNIRAIIENGLIDKKISRRTFVSDAIFFNSTDRTDRPV